MPEILRTNLLLELPHEDVLVNGEPFYKQVFEGVKEEIEIMSQQEAKVVVLGKLYDLLPAEDFHGSVSPAARLEKGDITEAGKQNADKILDTCYVPTTKGSGIRCVDGRPEQGFDDAEPSWYELGPQVQGGTIDLAAARRLREGVTTGNTLEQDVDTVVEQMSTDYRPAGHTDSHAKKGEFGCGAVKGQETKLDYYTDEAKVSRIEGVTAAIYDLAGMHLPENVFADLPKNASDLRAVATTYYANKPNAIEYLEKFNTEAKKVVEGGHNEYKLRLNFVHGTTLNTNKMNLETDGNYQVFGLDVWYILEECGEDAPFVLADAIATVMNLTDGSVEVDARLPVDANELVAA